MAHWIKTSGGGVVVEDRRKSRGMVALVVDDDRPIRALITASLRRKQIRVEDSADGAEAIALLGHNDYQALVLDLMMPRVSGWDVIEWLGEHPERKPQTVIVVTAADQTVISELNPEVVNAVIFKPFDVIDLATYVRSCLSHGLPVDRRKRRVVQ
ncbi:MAG: response regulator [Acidobacteria bacterium]|nr:response regulator [Acidobacteriota bacterium]